MQPSDDGLIMRPATPGEVRQRWQCPACARIPGSFQFTDGDTLDVSGFRLPAELRRYGASIYVGPCPACDCMIYEVEITVVSEPCPARDFIPDNFWKYQGEPEIYRASLGHGTWQWRVQHELSVVFTDNLSFPKGHRIDWLDRHLIGPFADDPEFQRKEAKSDVGRCSTNVWDYGDDQAITLLPAILEWNWE